MTPELRHGLYAVDPKDLGGDKYEAEREQDRENEKARYSSFASWASFLLLVRRRGWLKVCPSLPPSLPPLTTTAGPAVHLDGDDGAPSRLVVFAGWRKSVPGSRSTKRRGWCSPTRKSSSNSLECSPKG